MGKQRRHQAFDRTRGDDRITVDEDVRIGQRPFVEDEAVPAPCLATQGIAMDRCMACADARGDVGGRIGRAVDHDVHVDARHPERQAFEACRDATLLVMRKDGDEDAHSAARPGGAPGSGGSAAKR